MTNLARELELVCGRQPDRIAFVDGEKRQSVTYGQLQHEIDELAAVLRSGGLQARQCVGLHLPSGQAYAAMTYAVWRCGACIVPIPVELTPAEKMAICRGIALDWIISPPSAASFARELAAGNPIPGDDFELLPLKPCRSHPPGFRDLNAAFIRFSSGTTGTAKGVVLSHETIFQRIEAVQTGWALSPEDRIVWLLSMAYHFAASIVAFLTYGASIVLHPRRVDLGRALVDATFDERGTILYGSPSHYDLMSRDDSRAALPSVRLAISTATSLPAEIAARFEGRFGIPLSQAYGIIEVGLPCMNLQHAGERVDSVGQVLPAYQLRLQASEGGERWGAIMVRGPGLLDAYYDPWRPRSEIMADGWFRTGDLGEFDEEGCLYIRGRASEMINVGGMKFFPHEVETVLRSHPAIADAVVFSTQVDAAEVGWAEVVAKPDASMLPTDVELRQFCAKQLAHFKVPQRIDFVPQLARTASGKVLRRPATDQADHAAR